MRIFLTGILGQLGYNLACFFHLHGHHIEGSYRTAYNHPDFLKNKLYPLDFSSDFKLIDQLQKIPQNIDILIHCAAATNVDQCEENIIGTYNTNTIGTGILCNWAKQRNIPMIYLSTDFVFEGKLDGNNEKTTPQPKGYYSKSKYFGEIVCSSYKNSSVLRWTPLLHCFRLKHHPRSLVDLIIDSSKNGNRLSLFHDKTFSPVSSLAIGQTILTHKEHPLLHVCSAQSLSVYDLATIILDKLKLPNIHYPSNFPIQSNYSNCRPKHSGMKSLYLMSKSIEDDLEQCIEFINSLSSIDRFKLGCSSLIA